MKKGSKFSWVGDAPMQGSMSCIYRHAVRNPTWDSRIIWYCAKFSWNDEGKYHNILSGQQAFHSFPFHSRCVHAVELIQHIIVPK